MAAGMDIARLGMEVNSDGLVVAIRRLDDFEQRGKKGQKAADDLAGSFKKLAGEVLALISAYKAYGYLKEASMMSSQYEMLGLSMHVAGENAGYSAKQMDQFDKAMQSAGISMIRSRQNLTMMAAANMDLGKSTDLARVAQDLARVANINSSEAFTRLVNGIKSGEVEVLRTLGLNVNFQASYQKLAQSLNKSTEALTDNEKMQARTNVVLEKAAGYAGIYETSLKTAGGQLLSFQRYLENFKVILGQAFGPMTYNMVMDAKRALDEFTKEVQTAENQARLLAIGSTISAGFKTVLDLLKSLGKELMTIVGGFNSLPTWMQEAGLVMAWLGGKKGLLVLASTLHLVEAFKTSAQGLADVAEGKISFYDWLTAGGMGGLEAAKKDLEEARKVGAAIKADREIMAQSTPITPGGVIAEGQLEKEFQAEHQVNKKRIDDQVVTTQAMLDARRKLTEQIDMLGKYSYDQELQKIKNQLIEDTKATGDRGLAYQAFTARKADLDKKYADKYQELIVKQYEEEQKLIQDELLARFKAINDANDFQREVQKDVLKLRAEASGKTKEFQAREVEEERRTALAKLDIEGEWTEARNLINERAALKLQQINETSLQRMMREWQDTTKLMDETTTNTLRSIQSTFTDIISRGIKGEINSLGDAWQAFCDAMVSVFASMVAQITTIWLASNIAGFFTNKPGVGFLDILGGIGGGGSGGGVAGVVGAGASVAGLGAKIASMAGIGGAASGMSALQAMIPVNASVAAAAQEASAAAMAEMSIDAGGTGILAGIKSSLSSLGNTISSWFSTTATQAAAEGGAAAGEAAGSAMAGSMTSALTGIGIALAGTEILAALTGGTGPTGAVMELMGMGPDTGHTPQTALAAITGDIQTLDQMTASLQARVASGIWPGAALEQVQSMSVEMQRLADLSGLGQEGVQKLAESLDPLTAKMIAAGQANEQMTYLLQGWTETLNQANESASWGAVATAEYEQRMISLAGSLPLPRDAAELLKASLNDIIDRQHLGLLTTQQMGDELQNAFAVALEHAASMGQVTTAQMWELAKAIQAIPSDWTSNGTINLSYGVLEGLGEAGPSTAPGGEVHHRGGVAGDGMGAWAWPRFHDGLRWDEIPAILQKGEPVFSRADVARVGGYGEVEKFRRGEMRQDKGNQPVVVNYNPTVNVSGGANAAEVRATVEQVLAAERTKLKRMLDQTSSPVMR